MKQCVVVSIDFKLDNDKYEVFTNRGKDKINSDPLSWAQRMQEAGAGEIILTDIDKDGTKSGLNIKIAEEITKKIDIPVILSGGCGLAEHFVEGFKKTNIQGICAGTFFSYRDQNFFEARATEYSKVATKGAWEGKKGVWDHFDKKIGLTK